MQVRAIRDRQVPAWFMPTLAYGVCHGIVDMACITTVLGAVSTTLRMADPASAVRAILTYNLVAFCLQLPLGALYDSVGKRSPIALWSCLIVAVGVMVAGVPTSVCSSAHTSVYAWAALFLVALGNASFHCAGGVLVLESYPDKIAPAGCFIAPGAFGVFCGIRLAQAQGSIATGSLLALLALSIVFLHHTRILCYMPDRNTPASTVVRPHSPSWYGACVLLALTVALRSYTGMVTLFPWSTEPLLAWALTAAVVAGKAAGGIVADHGGIRRASLASLGGAALLFPVSQQFPLAGIAAIVLFNATMPITLSGLAHLLPRSRGLAFGIASFALSLGALPACMGYQLITPWTSCILALVSLVTLLAGLVLADYHDAARSMV